MAEVVPIAGGPEEAKIRSLVGPVLLPFVTLLVYSFVWWYRVNRELADLGRKHGREDLGTDPMRSLLAVTVGWFLIIPPFLSTIGTWKRIKAAQRLVGIGEPEQGSGFVAFVLWFLTGLVYAGYMQSELNKVWRRQAALAVPVAPAASGLPPGLG